jgi:hypothetical protein
VAEAQDRRGGPGCGCVSCTLAASCAGAGGYVPVLQYMTALAWPLPTGSAGLRGKLLLHSVYLRLGAVSGFSARGRDTAHNRNSQGPEPWRQRFTGRRGWECQASMHIRAWLSMSPHFTAAAASNELCRHLMHMCDVQAGGRGRCAKMWRCAVRRVPQTAGRYILHDVSALHILTVAH